MYSVIDRYIVIILIQVLAAICLLNLNGVGVMLIGINQLFSPLLLLSAFSLIIIGLRTDIGISRELAIYLASLGCYLIIGGLTATLIQEHRVADTPGLLFRYLTGLVVTIAGYYATFIAQKVRVNPLKLMLVITTVATCFIPFGDMLNISGRIIVDSQRGAGLFGNPNEAGIIAAMGLACSLVLIKNKTASIVASVFFISMSILTFSKAVLFMIFLIYISNQLFKGRMSTSVGRLTLSVIVLYVLLINFRGEIASSFEENQAKRIDQFFSILMLEPSQESVESSRGYLWKKGFDYISSNPIVGNGLGALHSMEGANVAVNGGYAQGVHNSYLLKFGDAGVIAFILFVVFVIMVTYQSFKLARSNLFARVSFFYFMIFILDCMVTHNVELLRFHNYLLGTSIALLFIAKNSQMVRR